MNFVVLYSNTFAPRPEFCLFSARLAFLLYYYILYLQAVLFWGWKTSPLIAAEGDSDFWRMILSSSALTMCSEEQAKSTDNYRHIKLFAWACASVRDCVGLAECGVPVNKFIWEIYLQKTDFTCILGYSLLYFSASLLFSFTFPPRIPILLWIWRPVLHIIYWWLFVTSAFALACLFLPPHCQEILCLSKFYPKFSSSFLPSFRISLFDFGNQS